MLTIRKEQTEAMELVELQKFKKKVSIHLKKIWPENCQNMGDTELYASIDQGLQKAQRYGFKSEYDIVRFIDLMYTLSMDFDDDNGDPEINSLLQNNELMPTSKMDLIYDKVENYLRDLAKYQEMRE